MKKIGLAMTEEMFNDLDRVKDRHYASTVPAPRNEPIIITRNFRTLLRNIRMKNPATPLPANETRGVGTLSIISHLVLLTAS
jgi:hypothetical protein